MTESYKSTLLKTLIWRVIATTITTLSAWTVTGEVKYGLTVGALDFVLKTVVYFLFERAWVRKNAK